MIALAVISCSGRSVRAEPTPLVVAGALYDSASASVAPVAYLRWPVDDGKVLSLSQLGWTSAAGFALAHDPRLSWHSSIELTPVRAHLSHDVYGPDGRTPIGDGFDDTCLRLTTGELWETPPLRVHVRAVVVKNWLAGASWPAARAFDSVFAGSEWKIVLEDLEDRDPFDARIEGVRVALRAEALISNRLWADADVTLSLGRRMGPLFARLSAAAFYVNWDTPVTDVMIGGSWDSLAANALLGFPLSAFRLAHGATATAGFDLKLFGPLELGLRGSGLWGAPRLHGGIGILLHAAISGVHWFVGAASPDARIMRGELDATAVFGGASAALLFLP
jgi:hypothetical protein